MYMYIYIYIYISIYAVLLQDNPDGDRNYKYFQ